MKTVGIVGLGLIGGSFAKALHSAGYRVLAMNRSAQVLKEAENVIDGVLTQENIGLCDFIIIALYPSGVIDFFNAHRGYMKKGAIVVDCAGVKERICKAISRSASENGIFFIGGHPMAGVENSGFASSFAELFKGAAMILCKDEYTDDGAITAASELFMDAGFGYVKISTPDGHDAAIAYTSQLAHIVSSAYMQSETAKSRRGFSAGSYKDLTRVAKLNERMWTELFFENRDCLLAETDAFIERMTKFRQALSSGNHEKMTELLRRGRLLKEADTDD